MRTYASSRSCLVIAITVCTLAACGNNDTSAPPTFSAVYDDVLFVRCADASCHGGGEGGAGKLDLSTRDNAYAALVDQMAAGPDCKDSGQTRVIPAEPEHSLLYLKLRASPPCGSRMPLGGALGDEDLRKIKAWIAAGALDE